MIDDRRISMPHHDINAGTAKPASQRNLVFETLVFVAVAASDSVTFTRVHTRWRASMQNSNAQHATKSQHCFL